MTGRQIRRLLYGLLILALFVIVIHNGRTAYWLVKDGHYSGQPHIPTEDQSDYNEQQNLQYLESPIQPLQTYNSLMMEPNEISKSQLPWYFKDGLLRPNRAKMNTKTGQRITQVWPKEQKNGDRIENQLMFIPPNYRYDDEPKKKILLFNGLNGWMIDEGQSVFISKQCPVNRCTITSKKSEAPDVDAILFRDHFSHPGHRKTGKQVWILYFLESPYHTELITYNDVFNWTATYRHDSDIVTPYERWAYYDPSVKQVERLERNYAFNKTKQVAWFVSNCGAKNGRLQYARELAKYISVDVYGVCGQFKCPRSDKCFQMLDQDYKFYLAFENSNCLDYVTEKFFVNGLHIIIAYCPVKNRHYSRRPFKYEKKMKMKTNDDEQIVETLKPPILSKNPDRLIKRNTFKNLPWYFKDGTQEPNQAKVDPVTGVRSSRLWPEEKKSGDRVEEQLMFIPPNYKYEDAPMKNILLHNGLSDWMVDIGQSVFLSNDCPVNRCTISNKQKLSFSVDAIVFRDEFDDPFFETGFKKNNKQIWILFSLKSAYYSGFYEGYDMINWTATYRHDSDIVIPYGRWAYFDPSVTRVERLNRNYSLNKTKQVAMIVSNCDTDNKRLLYAKELGKYISVDIYGQCEGLITNIPDNFLQILDRDYKFYLAFESTNCIDYVTEKFFIDGLQYNVLPIVMGGRREDYERMAPRRSYLHVDDYESPERLAEFLWWLNTDDDLYNEFFRWKGTGEFIDTKFFCRLCALLHDYDAPVKHYQDLERWWRPPDVCDHSTKWLKPLPSASRITGDQRLAAAFAAKRVLTDYASAPQPLTPKTSYAQDSSHGHRRN